MDLVNDHARWRLGCIIADSLHNDDTISLDAEALLSEAFDAPDHALLLLAIVECTLEENEELRVSAAARFKEIVRCRWPRQDDSKDHLPHAECSFIRERILPILRRARGPVESEVAEAIVAIATHDFPSRWDGILPYITSSLQAAINHWDLDDIRSLLFGASSVISSLGSRNFSTSNGGDHDMGVCHPDLEYCVSKFFHPLKTLTFRLQGLITSLHPPQHSLTCLVLCYRIFTSLNNSQMHILFKNDLQIWISSFTSILNANIIMEDVDVLYIAACTNLKICVVQYSAEPMVYITDFIRLLQTILNKSSSKKLLETAMNILCTVVRSQTLRNAVVADHSVIELCKNFIMPHLMLRGDDEMMFTHDWENFDSFGLKEQDGLRRSACDLLEEIAVFQQRSFWLQVLELIIRPALLAYADDPANQWKTKDAALRVFIALVRLSGDIPVSMEEFIMEHIEPELDQESLPLLMAGELRFLVLFKDKLTRSTTLRLFPKVVKFLQHGSAVVRYHAATYIKELVSQNLPTVSGGNIVVTISSNTIETVVLNILRALQFPDPGGHPYLLKCLIAVLSMVNGQGVLHIAQKLVSILDRMCNQARHADFCHYLFEALSITFGEIINKCSPEQALYAASVIIDTLKSKIIFNRNLLDLWHYSFQVLAQVINSVSLQESDLIYMSETVVDNATQSDRKECCPAMIRLLRATLKRIPYILYQEDKLQRILAIPMALFETSTTYDSGFKVLNILVEMDIGLIMKPRIPCIFTVLLSLLDDWMQRGEKVNIATFYRKECVVFTSLVILRYGLESTVTSIGEATERAELVTRSTARTQRSNEQCFHFFTRCYWSADFYLVKEESEVQVTVAAFSLFLKGYEPVRADPVWCGELLNRILATLFTNQSGDADDEDTLWLRCTQAADNDVLLVPDRDPKILLLESLIQFRQMKPDILHRVMMLLIPEKKDALLQFAADHNAIID